MSRPDFPPLIVSFAMKRCHIMHKTSFVQPTLKSNVKIQQPKLILQTLDAQGKLSDRKIVREPLDFWEFAGYYFPA